MKWAVSIWLASSDPSDPDFQLKLPDLPYGLEESRHILNLDNVRWALAALLALLLLLAIRRWLRKPAPRPSGRMTATKKVGKRPVVPVPAIAARIGSLRDRHLAAGTFREGCYELASVLRNFYEDLWRESLTTRTVGEIQRAGERRIGAEDGGAPGRLFGVLEGLQFSRHDPSADDLEAICDLASDVTSIYRDPLKERQKAKQAESTP